MIREAHAEELEALTALCLRSKAHWGGYDADFMAACVDELTLRPEHLGPGLVVWDDGALRGVAQVSVTREEAHLEDMFIDPSAIGQGLGRKLFDWATSFALTRGARSLSIDSDPFAEPFYARMGAVRVGIVPSGSVPGRVLPRLSYTLGGA